jgi:S-adenosylhomocysteine hydrolase
MPSDTMTPWTITKNEIFTFLAQRAKTSPYKIIVDSHLADLQSCVAQLKGSSENRQKHEELAVHACELSRDIVFDLGVPSDYEESYLKLIRKILKEAEQAIVDNGDDKMKFYKSNIESRIEKLKGS